MKNDNRNSGFIEYMQEIALKSILFEVAATPKPGLVDRDNQGAHSDMDFFTFMASSAALSSVFAECSRKGLDYPSADFPGLLSWIRPIGLAAEKRMFQATGGVNTHKGLVFSLGIICAAAGSIYRDTGNQVFTAEQISNRVKEIGAGITARELKNIDRSRARTKGEKLYLQYGVKGVRGQVESGYSTVIAVALPVLKEMRREHSIALNNAFIQVLLHLMTVTEDSNVIGRLGLAMLDEMQARAKKALYLGGILTEEGRKYIEQMDRDFIMRGISPGGSADLLAVTIMLYLLETGGII